nr:RNA-directed DNA polymerase, eukaryota [Tanacetum cinerariifolium]
LPVDALHSAGPLLPADAKHSAGLHYPLMHYTSTGLHYPIMLYTQWAETIEYLIGPTDENRYICAWLLEVEAAIVTSRRVLFFMPSQNIAKLIGFTMDDDPVVVVVMGHEIVHTLQVYDRPSQQFHTLEIIGVVQLSSNTRAEPYPTTSNLVRIIPGHAGIVQQAKLLKEKVFILDSDEALIPSKATARNPNFPPLNGAARVSTFNLNSGRVASYAKIVNGRDSHVPSSSPAMVLDDSHIVTRDLSNEGFMNVNVAYLDGLWVLIDLETSTSMKKIMEHVGVASWFTNLTSAHSDFVARDRIVWVDIEGVPLHAWSRKTFNKIGCKWGEEDNILEKFKIIVRGKIFVVRAKELFAWSPNFKSINDHVYCSDEEPIVDGDIADKGDATKTANSDVDSDDEGVSDTMYGDNADNLDVNQGNDKPGDQEVSSDPFSVYNLLNKQDAAKKGVQTNTDLDKSLSHPPGFTHEKEAHANNDQEIDRSVNNKDCHANVDDYSSSVTNNYANVGRSGGSILGILDDMIKGLGSKAKKDWIRDLNNAHKFSFLAIQETKMEAISAMDVKVLWGNYNFEYVYSEALGYSGGILYVWDSSSFHKEHHTISDNFVPVYGSWTPTKTKLLIISIYAPQHDAVKRVLWDYVSSIINRCDGDTIVMGDFNEIRLVEVQLEGFSFTWSHPSAKKMSKLDRFLVLEGFTSLFPRTSAICLDKHLSNHRLILLREVITDYGSSPFCFYHSWFKLNGFDVMVSNTWQSIMLDDSNAMIRFKKKLQCMKKAIRLWVTSYKRNQTCNEQADDLEIPISRDEIRAAVWDCGVNKSPGPDGFTFDFFRKYWNIVGVDFCEAIEWFFLHGFFAKGCNSSFLALIPKVHDPKYVSDFWPICLIGCLYKFVTKVLASRLTVVISDIVSDVQSAFIPNRQILDGPFIINEVLSWCKRKKQQVMIFKADFTKAYDSVRWDFLDDVLDAFGFGNKWRLWISGSLSSGMALILVNGVGVHQEKVNDAAVYLGCSVMRTLFKYLGVLVGGNMSQIKGWNAIIDKLHSRLSKWKCKVLTLLHTDDICFLFLESSKFLWCSSTSTPLFLLQLLLDVKGTLSFFVLLLGCGLLVLVLSTPVEDKPFESEFTSFVVKTGGCKIVIGFILTLALT